MIAKIIGAAWDLLDAVTSPWTVLGLGALSIALLATAVGQHLELQGKDRTIVEIERDQAQALAKSEAEARAWQTELQRATDRAREKAHADHVALEALAQQVTAQRDRIARLAGDADGLREQLAHHAAGGAGDTLATCQRRAAGLAQLLAEGAELVVEVGELVREGAELAAASAEAAHARAIDQDACVAGWVAGRPAD